MLLLFEKDISQSHEELFEIVGTIWHIFWVKAAQSVFIKDCVVTASSKTRVTVNTHDVTTTITCWIPGEGFELCREATRLGVGRALKTNNLFGVAILHEVRPVAAMNSLIVSESRSAWEVNRFSVSTLGVEFLAVSTREKAEIVFTDPSGGGNQFSCSAFAVDSPVVVAIVVHSAFAIKEQTIFASFVGYGSICTLVE